MERKKGPSGAKIAVIAVILAAVAFGLYLGYLAWTYDTFPSQQRPFDDYASVVSSTFNGTEYAFLIQWNNASYLPEYAQLSSPASDAANTPVCLTGLSAVRSGQTLFMAFQITPASAVLTNVGLSIAVKQVPSGGEFTIVYSVPSISAGGAPITPSNVSCQESGSSFE